METSLCYWSLHFKQTYESFSSHDVFFLYKNFILSFTSGNSCMNVLLIVELSMLAVEKVKENVDWEKPDYRKPLKVHAALAEWQANVFWLWGLFVLAHATFRSYWRRWTKWRTKCCFSLQTLTHGTHPGYFSLISSEQTTAVIAYFC